MRRYLKALCLVLILFGAACKKDGNYKNGQTYTVLPATLPENLNAVTFVDDQLGFVGGANGGIYKTTNGGKGWQPLSSTVNLPVYGLAFVSSKTGFAVGGQSSCSGTGCTPPGGFILRTTDGGESWTKVYTPVNKVDINSIYFVNASTGFCTNGNVILRTTNGGQTWAEYPIDNLGGKMMQINFITPQKGFIVGLFDKIVQTNDGGQTWQVSSPQFNIGYYAASVANGAIYVSGQGKVIKSTDSGSSWNVLANSPANVFSIYFVKANKGIAFGVGNYSGGDFGYFYGAMYTTTNGGSDWTGLTNITDFGVIPAVSFPGNGSIGYGISGKAVIRFNLNNY